MQGDSERLGVYKGVLWGFKGLLGSCQQREDHHEVAAPCPGVPAPLRGAAEVSAEEPRSWFRIRVVIGWGQSQEGRRWEICWGLRFYVGPVLSIAENSLDHGHIGLAFTLKNNKLHFTVQLAVSQEVMAKAGLMSNSFFIS